MSAFFYEVRTFNLDNLLELSVSSPQGEYKHFFLFSLFNCFFLFLKNINAEWMDGWMDQLSTELSTYLSSTVIIFFTSNFVSLVHLEEC